LDIYAQTFEEAVVLLAQKVDKFFDIDGTERPDVEYEKSEIEKTLEERVKDLPEQPVARHIPFDSSAG
jgi:hypothetical protein